MPTLATAGPQQEVPQTNKTPSPKTREALVVTKKKLTGKNKKNKDVVSDSDDNEIDNNFDTPEKCVSSSVLKNSSKNYTEKTEVNGFSQDDLKLPSKKSLNVMLQEVANEQEEISDEDEDCHDDDNESDKDKENGSDASPEIVAEEKDIEVVVTKEISFKGILGVKPKERHVGEKRSILGKSCPNSILGVPQQHQQKTVFAGNKNINSNNHKIMNSTLNADAAQFHFRSSRNNNNSFNARNNNNNFMPTNSNYLCQNPTYGNNGNNNNPHGYNNFPNVTANSNNNNFQHHNNMTMNMNNNMHHQNMHTFQHNNEQNHYNNMHMHTNSQNHFNNMQMHNPQNNHNQIPYNMHNSQNQQFIHAHMQPNQFHQNTQNSNFPNPNQQHSNNFHGRNSQNTQTQNMHNFNQNPQNVNNYQNQNDHNPVPYSMCGIDTFLNYNNEQQIGASSGNNWVGGSYQNQQGFSYPMYNQSQNNNYHNANPNQRASYNNNMKMHKRNNQPNSKNSNGNKNSKNNSILGSSPQ